MADPADDAAAFWRFSLASYARPGVAEACLALQDRHGLDVNLVLLCCWLGLGGRGRIDSAGLAATIAAGRTWREQVVEPLRALRRSVRALAVAGGNSFYESVKALEVAAEREAQILLVELLPKSLASSGDPEADAVANLAVYCALAGVAASVVDPRLPAMMESS